MSDQQEKFVTEEVLDLKLKAVVSAMTTRLVVAVVASAGIQQAELPAKITVPAVAVAFVAAVAKSAVAFLTRS